MPHPLKLLITSTLLVPVLILPTASWARADANGTNQSGGSSQDTAGFAGVLSDNGEYTVNGHKAAQDSSGTQTGFGKAAGQAPHASANPFYNPADCGLFQSGDEQHCECITAANTPLIVDYGVCEAQPTTPGQPKPPSQAAVLSAVLEASATLKLPDGVPVVSPDPANNEWNMIPIGYPIWLTTTAPQETSVSATQDGITITITATRGETAFNSGESPGKVIPYVYCWSMSQRKVHEYPPNKKSPDCGYVYKNMGTYTITATTTWHLSWSAAGYSGTLDAKRTAQAAKPLVVGQLKSRVVSVGIPTGGLG
ncbi:MAG: hypothetical protein FWF75_06125 [Propionibacteriaceae bacterium]|nr:hypothetical protein [Propionibacteriaceae bacterium]